MQNKIRQMNNEHSKVYDVVLELPFYHQHLNKILNELTPKESGIYLDAGCGTGNLINKARCNGYTFIGVDLSDEMLKKAKEKGIENLVKADITHLPFRNDYFDGITNVNVLYQLKEPKKFLDEANRVLKTGRKIVISTPDKKASLENFAPEFIKSLIKNPKIFLRMREIIDYYKINKDIIKENPGFYPKDKLEEMVKESGFDINKIEKVYAGQNWLVVAKKPREEKEQGLEDKVN
ncbi:MAG: class I SAM-dependent methyltransferase [Candidatus Parvarchaeota archaeon]|nr:class I SAM-dependent methyltransferase [Candidatus Jingweiarchaeum tengchongense]MCW1298679.1 class I SAM-dependent methyltransferase [Candidatus Jingweiarchaeum tengchongense]MCW1311062.1 class I SAM-dependent methyltransferase [Candidatus Jingweiarchaeum tengchongense]